jgi:receptor-type tyrosine-protein phosphatase gamma
MNYLSIILLASVVVATRVPPDRTRDEGGGGDTKQDAIGPVEPPPSLFGRPTPLELGQAAFNQVVQSSHANGDRSPAAGRQESAASRWSSPRIDQQRPPVGRMRAAEPGRYTRRTRQTDGRQHAPASYDHQTEQQRLTTNKNGHRENGNTRQQHQLLDSHVIVHRGPTSRYFSFDLPRPQSLILMQSAGRPPSNEPADNSETFYIRKGANGTLPCLPVLPADSQATQNKIEWFKEEKKLMEAEAKRIVVWNTKNSIAYLPETGSLLFRGVTNEDSGEYHCVLTRTTSSGESEDGIVRFYVQDVPDPPQMPIVIGFTHRSVNLSWVPSYDFHYSPIMHYIIHVRENVDGQWDVANGIMTPDNRTQYEIIGLKPFTTYSFRVLAVNSIGASEPSPSSHPIVTLRQKPDSRLTIISARNISSSAIRLEWLPPSAKEINGEFLGYRIRYVPQLHEHTGPAQNRSGGGQLYPAHNQPHQPSLDGPLAKEITVGDTKETSYVIKNLQTYTLYKISVQVSNPAGDGPVTEVLAMTDEGVASPPLDVTVLKATDTFVKLRWSEPRSPNGILQGYQINLYDIAQNLNETRKLSDPQSKMEHTIADLKPFTWYLVFIQAYSRKFTGEPSQTVKFRTDVSGPSPPQVINVTCFSQDSVHIQWQRPEDYYNQIDYYYVRYKALDSAWDSYTSSSKKEDETILSANKDNLLNELLITNLTTDEVYDFKVLAGTRSIHDSSFIYRSEPSQTYRVLLKDKCESK